MMILALDPGAHVGLALYGSTDPRMGPELHLCETYAWGDNGENIKARLRALHASHRVDLVAVEIPRQAGALFRHGRDVGGIGRALKMAKNVGQCAAKAEGLASFCEALGWTVVRKEPATGNTKCQNTPEIWQAKFPEWKSRTSEHARDAALLAQRVYAQARFEEMVRG